MNNKLKSLVSLFLFFLIPLHFADARNNPNILNSDTGTIFSARQDSFLFTFTDDGKNWRFPPEITGHANFNAIAYGNKTYVVVGGNSTVWYLKTDSGDKKWKEASLSGKAEFKAVEYGNGRFVAVATQGTIWYSDDGANWKETSSDDLENVDPYLYDVIYANGVFIAVGGENYYGAITIFVSPDGIAWHMASQITPISNKGVLKSIAYGNKTFVAVGSEKNITNNDANIYVSNDNGQSWRNVSVTPKINFNAVTYNNGMFVAVGDYATIWHSTDGSQWTMASKIDETYLTFNDVTFGNGVFVAVGNLGGDVNITPIWYSADGAHWHPAQGIQYDYCYAALPYFDAVYFDGTNFIATVRSPSMFLPEYYSSDGINWSSNQNPDNAARCGG